MPTVTRDHFDALVFDLDGTLLDGAGRLSDRSRAAVVRAAAAGYLVVLATGRSLAGVRDVHAALGLDTDVCAYNGAWIGPVDGTAPWHYAPIPDSMLSGVTHVEERARFHFRHQGEHKYTRRIDTHDHRRVAAWYRNVVEVGPPAASLPARDLVRVSAFFEGHEASDDAWGTLSADAKETLHREVFPMSIFPEFHDLSLVLCEVQRKGRGKAEVFRWLSERHGIPAARVVAAGDQQNDVQLLEGAGLAVSMGNGIPALREAADLVIGDHRDDGLARWLEADVV